MARGHPMATRMCQNSALRVEFAMMSYSTQAPVILSCSWLAVAPLLLSKDKKHGWWAAEGYIWAYYDTALFTKKAVPVAEEYSGSMENHCHIGQCLDRETAERDGPLLARGIWCGCQPCVNYDFGNCLMRSEFGPYKQVFVKLAKDQQLSQTRSMALEEFAESLDKGQVRAVHASRTEWKIEGPYWLVLILGKAHQTHEDQVLAGQEIPKGYWLVKAQWYKLVQTSQRPCICSALRAD